MHCKNLKSILVAVALLGGATFFGIEEIKAQTAPVCGDLVVALPEQCDDGNDVNTDACKNDCTTNVCGDGIVLTGVEACDDGNTDNNDACKNDCSENVCGDGVIEHGAEACDDGNVVDSDGCSADCQTAAQTVCGDGIPEGTEDCDDDNDVNTDACKNDCSENVCGDSVVETGVEECDDGNQVGGDGCSAFCEDENPVCGDAHLDTGEQCDDGNALNDDACKNNCSENICSDGILETGVEECDDGNSVAGDGCDANCQLETPPVCGNDIVETGEECDDGNAADGDGCDSDCQFEIPAGCGNGTTDPGEDCDDGNDINTDSCKNNCTENICGDGIVEIGVEECDDNNNEDDDGCSAVCTIEEHFCGDGDLDPGEQCDDGNDDNDDFCNDDCELVTNEEGQVCFCHNIEHNPHTICTSPEGFINGHQKHGDLLGTCEDNGIVTVTGEIGVNGRAEGCSLTLASNGGLAAWSALAAILSPLILRIRSSKRR